MSNPSLGTKRTCPKCVVRFYDLDKNPATCPKCQNSFDPVALLKPRRGRSRKASNLTADADSDESVLTSIMAKATASKKPLKVDLDDDDKEGMVEDAEEMEDFESIDELEAASEGESGDDATEETIMEDFDVEGEGLVDEIEDEEESEDEEEAEDPAPRRRR